MFWVWRDLTMSERQEPYPATEYASMRLDTMERAMPGAPPDMSLLPRTYWNERYGY